MKRVAFALLSVLGLLSLLGCRDKGAGMKIVIDTNLGKITAELYPDKAPATVSNVLAYVDEKFYDDTIFHRVIDGFMIQGGGFTKSMAQKPTKPPVKNEADNGLSNTRGTLAMARTMVPDSATCQFFINLVDNTYLDWDNPRSPSAHPVFGEVAEGMDIVDRIGKTKVGRNDRPVNDIVIKKAEVSE